MISKMIGLAINQLIGRKTWLIAKEVRLARAKTPEMTDKRLPGLNSRPSSIVGWIIEEYNISVPLLMSEYVYIGNEITN